MKLFSSGGSSLLLLLPTLTTTAALEYQLSAVGDVSLLDVETGIPDVLTLFTNQEIAVSVTGLEWEEKSSTTTDESSNSTTTVEVEAPALAYETLVDGILQDSGIVSMADISTLFLPDSVDVGSITVTEGGKHTIEVNVKLLLDGEDAESIVGDTQSTSGEYTSYAPGVSIIPLVVILVLAVTTNMVRCLFVCMCLKAG